MKKTIMMLAAAVMLCTGIASAQGRKALRINEVMVTNNQSVTDGYGNHTAWVELFNSNFAPLEISSVFLTTDPANPTMYPVPLGDQKTRMGKRQHVIFFADGQPKKGTFHTNFVLNPGKANWIGLYDADGLTLIDSVTVPAALEADQSYARTKDGAGKWQVRNGNGKNHVSAGGPNVLRESNPKVKRFKENDSHGFSLTVTAMGIVFSALLVLCLCFYGTGAIGKYVSRLNKARAKGVDVAEVSPKDHDSGEEIAAVVMALHQHLNAHDNESNLLTIRKIKRAYSPWSSKIYSLRELPRH